AFNDGGGRDIRRGGYFGIQQTHRLRVVPQLLVNQRHLVLNLGERLPEPVGRVVRHVDSGNKGQNGGGQVLEPSVPNPLPLNGLRIVGGRPQGLTASSQSAA